MILLGLSEPYQICFPLGNALSYEGQNLLSGLISGSRLFQLPRPPWYASPDVCFGLSAVARK